MALGMASLDRDHIRTALGSEMTGIPIYVYDRLRSTNDTAQQLIAQQPEESFAAVLAEQQDGGRGRRGRAWVSPPGAGLLLSIAMSYPSHVDMRLEEWPLLAALGVRGALARTTGLPMTIKWPNDLRVHGKKVAGILTEAALAARSLVIGIGVNVNTDSAALPPDVRLKASSLAEAAGHRFDRNELAAAVIAHMHMLYVDTLGGLRFSDRHQEWLLHCDTVGQHVRLACGGETLEGIVQTIDVNGTLQLLDRQGFLHQVISGEIVESFTIGAV